MSGLKELDGQPSTSEVEKPQFDAIVALGKNWRLPVGPRIQLSIESKMTVLAAGQMYADGKVGKIIFSTGETAGKNLQGHTYPAEADQMKKFLRRFFSEEQIPDAAIELENHSFDTAGNAEEVRTIINDLHLQKVALLTVGFHLPRSMRLFKSYGVNVDQGLSSEQILEARSSHYQGFLDEYHQSDRYKNLTSTERKVNAISIIDRKGKLIRLITKRSRHRENPLKE
jgi:uncharacterized SAM-binding protein YcdF (DUF218 family)